MVSSLSFNTAISLFLAVEMDSSSLKSDLRCPPNSDNDEVILSCKALFSLQDVVLLLNVGFLLLELSRTFILLLLKFVIRLL